MLKILWRSQAIKKYFWEVTPQQRQPRQLAEKRKKRKDDFQTTTSWSFYQLDLFLRKNISKWMLTSILLPLLSPTTTTKTQVQAQRAPAKTWANSVSQSGWDTAAGQGSAAQETVNGVFKWILLPSSSQQEMCHISHINSIHLWSIIRKKNNTRSHMISNHTPFYSSKLTGNTAYEASFVT